MGRTRLSVAQKLTDWLRLEHQILCSAAEWSARVLAFEERLFAAGCPVLPGAREIIHLLHKRERRLAVATSSNRRSFQIKTAPHQESLFSRFSVIVCGDELECPGQCKPHPRIFQKAHAALDPACASVALAFEDSPNGVIAALRANCDVIWVPGEEVRGAAGLVGALEEVIEDEQCAGEIDSERFVLRLGSILELIN
jgi:pseudouridine-5'-monophosphatase